MRDARGWMLIVSVALAGCEPVLAPSDFGEPSNPREEARILAEAYGGTAERLAALPESPRTRERASRYGIEVVNLLAEVAVRAKLETADAPAGIAGLEVLLPGGTSKAGVLAPAFRSPSAPPLELASSRFFIRVGNHHGEPRRTVALNDFLSDMGRYITSPASLTGATAVGERLSLSAPRDDRMTVEVQAVAVPVPARGRASIRPVVWSAASTPRSPALLTVVATASGTSVRVIENRPEERSTLGSGQAIDINDGGQRRPISVETEATQVVVVIEVPLLFGRVDVRSGAQPSRPAEQGAKAAGDGASGRAALDTLGGPFQEGSGFRVERDEARPLRATAFLLVPIRGGDLEEEDWERIAGRVRSAARNAEELGSFVMPKRSTSGRSF